MVAVTLASLVQGCMESGVGVAFWKIASATEAVRDVFLKTFFMDFITLNIFFVGGPLLLVLLFGQSPADRN